MGRVGGGCDILIQSSKSRGDNSLGSGQRGVHREMKSSSFHVFLLCTRLSYHAFIVATLPSTILRGIAGEDSEPDSLLMELMITAWVTNISLAMPI